MSKKKRKKILFYTLRIILLIFLFIPVFFLARASWSAYNRYAFAKDKLSKGEYRLALAKKHKSELEEKLKELESDFGTEKILRENYSFVLPGEKLLIIIDEPDTKEGVQEAEPKPWWQALKFW